LFVSVYFLSVPHLQYQHILLTRVHRRNFKKWTILGTCTNNGSKIKLSTNRGRITFAWIWGLTGITFARRKSIAILKYTWEVLVDICGDCLLLIKYIYFIHNIFCILQHDWRCNIDYSPLSSAFKMETKNIRITYKYMKYKFKKRLICNIHV
jgi:hypothetical protein